MSEDRRTFISSSETGEEKKATGVLTREFSSGGDH
tara:strand:+ start:81 stop:185 length:105 start_codon:yes stop_codon:yes gene_type:complete